MTDIAHSEVRYQPSELEHRYPPTIHILANPFLATRLAWLCDQRTGQPKLNSIIRGLYRDLVRAVIAAEFPRKRLEIQTRMAPHTDRATLVVDGIDPSTRVICVDIARAGMLPSQVCFDVLNNLLDPSGVRQDHLIMERTTDQAGHVTGAAIHGSKIGGDTEQAYVLFPDPMGATGTSLVNAMTVYREGVAGTPTRLIALNLIVTPEYIRRITSDFPETLVYALRVDRGLSPPDVLAAIPGARWDEECGLTDNDYIVPGAGGLGEVINNAFV
jgi:uracil phosphoribosyltransferase